MRNEADLKGDLLGLPDLLRVADEREHDADVVVALVDEPLDGLELGPEELRLVETAPDSAPSEHRVPLVRLLLSARKLAELVGRGVEGPVPDAPRVEGLNDGPYALD
ncbi:hypothetical protein APY94_09650, partial [Thermococcus celericrescens]